MDPELQQQAALRWEQLVASGMSKDEAKMRTDAWLAHRMKAVEFKAEADQYAVEAGQKVELEPEAMGVGGRKAVLRHVLSGATLGAADYLGPAVRALPRLAPGGQGFGEAYSEGVEAYKAGRSASRAEHPILATGTEIAGAAAPAMLAAPAAGAREGAKLGLRKLMALGAAEGGAAGALETRGGLEERARGAAVGAGAGMTAGAVLPIAGRGIGAVGTRILDVSGLRPKGGMFGRLFERLGVESMASRAESRLAGALPEGEALTEATRTLSETTRPLTPMDISENVAGVARAARGVQGEAKAALPSYLAQRTAGQEARILDDALRLTGVGERSSMFESVQDVIRRRADHSRPLYDAIRDKTVPSELVEKELQDPIFQDALATGLSILRREGGNVPENLGNEIPVIALDYMKQGLDDVIERGLEGGRKIGRREARALRGQLNDLLSRVDEVVPEYAQARAAYAGESRMLDALEQGHELFKLDPAEARQIVEALPDSEREMFVRGGLEALAERVEDASSSFDITRRRPLADRTRDKQRLRLLFPDDQAFEQFQTAIAQEAQIARTGNYVTGGSNTAEKLAEMAELSGVDVASLLSGNVVGLGARIAQSAVRRRSQGFTAELGRELMPLLTAEGEEGARVLTRLAQLRSQVGTELSRREVGAVVAGSTAYPRESSERRRNR